MRKRKRKNDIMKREYSAKDRKGRESRKKEMNRYIYRERERNREDRQKECGEYG